MRDGSYEVIRGGRVKRALPTSPALRRMKVNVSPGVEVLLNLNEKNYKPSTDLELGTEN